LDRNRWQGRYSI